MTWTLVVPVKPAGLRKTRLSDRLTAREREALVERMFRHVTRVLNDVPGLNVVVLARDRPFSWTGGWLRSHGAGLNEELQAVRARLGRRPFAVLHADLATVSAFDVMSMLVAAENAGCSLAPDRHGAGTNGLAIADGRSFSFAFGGDSFHRHQAAPGARAAIVEREGLALDVDTWDDLAIARGRNAAI